LDINEKKSDFNINKISYVRLVAEDENFVLGARDWADFKLGEIDGDISCGGVGCEITFKHNEKIFYVGTKNNPNTDNITKQILSTFKFIK
jgi:hypothetical protein